MEIKLNLLKENDVYELYRILGDEKSRLVQDNYKHIDMIKLLVGNYNNELAKEQLDCENHCVNINNNNIIIIDNIRDQLRPLVDKVVGGH